MTQPAVCELNKCGVLAIGRCTKCHKAFCKSHQGYDVNNGLYPKPFLSDECLDCSSVKQAEKNAADHIANSYEPALRNRIKAIAQAMAEAEVPNRIARRYHYTVYKKGGFLRDDRYDSQEGDLEPAWRVGQYYWQSGDTSSIREIGVTTTGTLVVMGNTRDNFVGMLSHGSPLELERQLGVLDSFYHTDRPTIPEALDQIRGILELLAQKHGVKLEPWRWPPQNSVISPAALQKKYK